MLNDLLKDIDYYNLNDYTEMFFNLYEDADAYSIEVVFDDDKLIIGREDKYYRIGEKNVPFDDILNDTASALKKYFKENKEKYRHIESIYRHIESISFGFVDGDLYYFKKHDINKEQVHFSIEDFYSFDPFKIRAWLTVYLNSEGKQKYGNEVFETDFMKLSADELHKWCEILALYFDYEKYNR